jgi:hypothetical protein
MLAQPKVFSRLNCSAYISFAREHFAGAMMNSANRQLCADHHKELPGLLASRRSVQLGAQCLLGSDGLRLESSYCLTFSNRFLVQMR